MSSTERGKPLKRKQREFGLVLGSVLLAAGAAPLLKSSAPRWWALTAAAAVYLAAAASPGLLAVPYRVMLKAGHVMGRINAKLVLGFFYFLILVPVSLAMRAAGKRPVDDSFKTGRPTYWHRREKATDPKSFERMF